jgi:hypothetical protein
MWHLDYRDGKFVPLGESGPNIRVLKDNRRELTPEERQAVIDGGGTWPDGKPGVWKAW